MTTTTQLAKYRSPTRFDGVIGVPAKAVFRELWADGLATLATVTLFSILAFELVRLVIP